MFSSVQTFYTFFISATLLTLDISWNELTTVRQSSLAHLIKLTYLNIDSNRITEVPWIPSSLQYLNCENNNITYVSTTHFVNSTLTELILSNNPLSITELVLPISLKVLKLEVVEIQTLTLRCFSPGQCVIKDLLINSALIETPIINEIKPTLTQYNLRGRLGGIPQDGLRNDAFTELLEHINLRLSHHLFDPVDVLNQHENAKYMTFQNFDITDDSNLLSQENIHDLSSLVMLSLEHNLLTTIPSIISTNMKKLMLNENNITFVDRNVLMGMPNLLVITLRSNMLLNFQDFPYRELSNIESIDFG